MAVAVLLLHGYAWTGVAQSAPAAAVDANAIVRRAIGRRLEEGKNHRPVEYLLRKKDERHDTTKLIVETKDGDVARLVAFGGKALPPEVNTAELDRLDTLAAHPELQERRRRSEQKDADRVTHLLGQLPDAFVYQLEGTEACPSGECYRLSYTPNPKYQPPDTESRIFRGIAGEVWIDTRDERLTKLEARFLADVDFAFGILGKVNKGGTVVLEQSEVGAHDWELTSLEMHVTGEILVFKSFSSQVTERMSHFEPVPAGIGYRDAIQMLKSYDPSAAYTP